MAKAQAAIDAAKHTQQPGHYRRRVLRAALITLSVVIALDFIAWADYQRQSTGTNRLSALGPSSRSRP